MTPFFQFHGHTILSIQSMYEAILVYTPGSSVPHETPNDTIPTIVETPDRKSLRKTGPPESPC